MRHKLLAAKPIEENFNPDLSGFLVTSQDNDFPIDLTLDGATLKKVWRTISNRHYIRLDDLSNPIAAYLTTVYAVPRLFTLESKFFYVSKSEFSSVSVEEPPYANMSYFDVEEVERWWIPSLSLLTNEFVEAHVPIMIWTTDYFGHPKIEYDFDGSYHFG